MKKLMALALALCMAAAMSVTAFAVTVDQSSSNPSENPVNVTTRIDPTYMVTIPADTEVTYDDNKATSTVFGTISATNVRLTPDKKIVVSVASDLKMENAIDNTKTLPYAITSGGQAFTSVNLLATGDKADLKIDITADAWAAAYAGSYSDTVTFTVAYTNIAVAD